jgi:malonyl CoA-acyl carrier protein transacylase
VHILVVEDEQRLGRLLQRSLQANRHVVDVVTTIAERTNGVAAGTHRATTHLAPNRSTRAIASRATPSKLDSCEYEDNGCWCGASRL